MRTILCADTPNVYTGGDIEHVNGYYVNISSYVIPYVRSGDVVTVSCESITYNGSGGSMGVLYFYYKTDQTPIIFHLNMGLSQCRVLSLPEVNYCYIYFGLGNTDGNVKGLQIKVLNRSIRQTLIVEKVAENPILSGNIITLENTFAGRKTIVPVHSKNLFNPTLPTFHDVAAQISNMVQPTLTAFRVVKTQDASYSCVSWALPFRAGTVTLSGTWNEVANTRGGLLLYWYENAFTTFIAQLVNSGDSVTIDIPSPPSREATLALLAYASLGVTSRVGAYVDYTNVQLEFGNTKTTFTPYISDGTETTLTTTGRNLVFPEDWSIVRNDTAWFTYSKATDKVVIKAGAPNSVSQSVYHFPMPIPKGTKVTITATCESGRHTGTLSVGGYCNIGTRSWQGSIDFPRDTDLTGKVYTKTMTTTDVVTDFWLFDYAGTEITEDVVFKVQYEIGDKSNYAQYEEEKYDTKVGEYLDITQFDGKTTVYTNNEGVATSSLWYPNTELFSLRQRLKVGDKTI